MLMFAIVILTCMIVLICYWCFLQIPEYVHDKLDEWCERYFPWLS